MELAGLTRLLQWQWRAYWRKLLRAGPGAQGNLLILGLLAAAGMARYVTFLREATKQTASGKTGLLDLLLAALLLLTLLPVWDTERLALGSREMARFPLSPLTRFGLRTLSRFVVPAGWALGIVCLAAVWPLFALPHAALAIAVYLVLMLCGFLLGVAMADAAQTAIGSRVTRLVWPVLAAAAAAAWWAGLRMLPPLPSHWVIQAGAGQWILLPTVALFCIAAAFLAARTLPWMLRHAPPGERSGHATSAAKMTFLRRELRSMTRQGTVRTVWLICVALAFYLLTAAHPEPDALRVMLGVLAFFSIAVARNSFGVDRVPGLDRILLFPVAASRVIAMKNRAFAISLILPAVPLAACAAWRFGWREGVSDLFEALAIGASVLAWGNITSVRHPEDEKNGLGGNIIDQLIALGTVALPAAASLGSMRSNERLAPLYCFGVAIVFGLAYWVTLRWTARYFERSYERMRQMLGG